MEVIVPVSEDGPCTKLFSSVNIKGNISLQNLDGTGISKEMISALKYAPAGKCVAWGIPFDINKVILIKDKEINIDVDLKTQWLVFLHTTDIMPLKKNKYGFISPMGGDGRLGEHVADYIVVYSDGTEFKIPINRRYQINMFVRRWGENCFESVSHIKPCPVRPHHEQLSNRWGWSQTRTRYLTNEKWMNWLYAWKNPYLNKKIASIRFIPKSGITVLSSISAGEASDNPLRWQSRKKAILKLPKNEKFKPDLDNKGLLEQVKLDMGQVISAILQPVYPNKSWRGTPNNSVPEISEQEVLIEYTAHPDAVFHISGEKVIPLKNIEKQKMVLQVVTPATQRVTLKVVEKGSKKYVPVRLHIHGEAGEYLAPIDRNRIPNPSWFEDYSCDYVNEKIHYCTYITGKTVVDLPLGNVYIEISKGFEIVPVRKTIKIQPSTDEITIEIEKALMWREKGWVTADTHVHFLSPKTALLEGESEGVNIVNLLASQWGELMTNVGDFDGKTTFGSKETGGNGEYLVRVGTENRQDILGHISLLGYEGDIIAPMTTGGPDESALGDPVEALLTEWAEQCKKQDGLVIIPHFPSPRLENAAVITSGNADGVELKGGIGPYSLSDWYRYLNCGLMVPIVGGTDKMEADTAVGNIRTYTYIGKDEEFTYELWKKAIRKGNTFVTAGPLMEFSVDGNLPGTRIKIARTGGTVNVEWKVDSVTLPISKVELIVNGEIIESKSSKLHGGHGDSGKWEVKIKKSSWIALLVRGYYSDKLEIIAAHSSPVMIDIEGIEFSSAADAVTILNQIQGAIAYLDTVGTRAETEIYKRMKLKLTAIYRSFHNRMHQMGHFHNHNPLDDHSEHH
ncbi:MAG: CehA/McbA family metallohydrolase [Elusimicrobia bacterium]|nr:CehA/McbA family metallohydrolase [Elusimicrobiota bacterium]